MKSKLYPREALLRFVGALVMYVLFFGQSAQAQTTFRVSYDIASLDIAGGMVQSPAGDFVMAGTNTTFIPLYGNITKLNSTGNVVWSKAYTGGIATDFWDIKNVSGGGYVAVGSSSGNGAIVVRVDDNGALVWARRITLPNHASKSSNEYATSVIQSSDGGFVVGGYVDYYWDGVSASTVDTSSAFGFKLDNSGNFLWSRVWTISTANPDEHIINDVTETADGYIFVGESSEGSGTLDSDGDYPRNALLIKTDLLGNSTYVRRWGAGNTTSQGINSAITLSGGNVLMGGYDDIHAFLISVTGTGGTPTMGSTFNRRFNGNVAFPIRTLIIQDIMQNSDGNYSIIGTHLEGALFPTFYSAIYKVNASTGAIMFAKGYTSIGLSSILPEGGLASDQGYFMAMTDQQVSGFNYNIIRTDANGNINDSDPGCPASNLTPPTTTYSVTLSTPTTSNFNNASGASFTPTVTNITPTRTEHCLNVVCTPPSAPTASASPTTICAGQSSTLTASGGSNVTYYWYTVSSGGTSFASGSSTTVSPSTTTTYYVEADDNTNPGCKSSRTSVTVTVNALPNVVASPASPSICSGSSPSIALSSNVAGTVGVTSFSWTASNGSNVSGASNSSGTSINQTLTNSGTSPSTATYTVTPTANGCTGSNTVITVTVNPIPTGSASPNPQTICSGQTTSVNLSSNVSGTTFAWTSAQSGTTGASNSSGSSIAQTLSTSGTTAGTATYTVTPTANSCNGNTFSVTVNVNPVPTATATPSAQTICSGNANSIALTSNVASTSFAWTVSQSGVTGASNGSGSTIAQTLTNSGTTAGTATYTITPTAGSCAGSNITATVTVNPTPNATATPSSQTICSGQSTSIALSSAVAGTSFAWTVAQSGTAGASNGTGSSIAQTLTTSGTTGTATYTVTPSANSCNGTPVNVVITVNETPDLTGVSASATTICEGSSATITATGTSASSFNVYDASSGGTLLGATPLSVTPTTTTTYYVEAANINGCSDPSGRTSVTVTVIPVADPSWTSPGATCVPAGPLNLNTLITGTAGGTWSGTGVTGNIFDPSGLAGQTVNITYTVGTSPCVQVSTQSISVQSTITASWNNPGTICESDGILNLNSLITGTAGGTWSGTGVSGTNFDPTGLSGSVAITYSVGVSPCQDAITQNITVNSSPIDPTVNASNSSICEGDNVTITASGSGAGVTYNVYDAASGGTLLGTTPYTASPTSTGTYYVEAVNGNGCTNLSGGIPVTITVNALPVANAGNDVTICPGSSTTLVATGGGNYAWNTGDNSAGITVAPSTTQYYVVTVTNASNCSQSDSVLVTVYNTGSLGAENDSAYLENTQSISVNVALNDNGNVSSASIIGGPNHGQATIIGTTVAYDPQDGYVGYDTLYYVICDNFCSSVCDTAMVVFRITEEIVIDVPGGFSPNGDGINDLFVISGLEKYPENELYIYNRWGELVYSANPYTNNWDGTSNNPNRTLFGKEVVDGTYFYVLKLNATDEPLRGSLELRRK